jgi:hypothetical protein
MRPHVLLSIQSSSAEDYKTTLLPFTVLGFDREGDLTGTDYMHEPLNVALTVISVPCNVTRRL